MDRLKNGGLISLRAYRKLSPRAQGYVAYMQAARAGSELKEHDRNPYAPGTPQHQAWSDGQTIAALEAQDSDD